VRALALLDQAVQRASKGKLLMTCFVTVIDLSTGRASYASAGHPSPFVVNASSGKLSCWMARGPLLGGTLGQSLSSEHTATLEPGDVILWFTDGLSECSGPGHELWGERRLRHALRQAARTGGPGEIRAALEQAVTGFAGSGERDDDLTFVVGRFR
jgi:serine phosphatase RsbU (regulator of sigma subunit)